MTASRKAGDRDKQSGPKDSDVQKKIDEELDEALEESFPASDPPSMVQPPHTKQDKDGV
jgi:hypothetical protein